MESLPITPSLFASDAQPVQAATDDLQVVCLSMLEWAEIRLALRDRAAALKRALDGSQFVEPAKGPFAVDLRNRLAIARATLQKVVEAWP